MPHHQERKVTGTIAHVFGHRFVVEAASGFVLADLTPHGAEKIKLRIGDEVTIEGEMKPTELKVFAFTHGGTTVHIEHGPKHGPKHHHHHHDHHHHPDADPAVATDAAKAAGYDVIGEPRRKPKHFEVLGRRNRKLSELHIELDGHIRKVKPVERDDHKWADVAGARA
ncbi:MAG: hypothetical protein JSR72_04480 [Proteobacteria bacterium]|nr:hypothetical protein [Pseudomonadota bacterium]